jgi:hypothetical protein
MQLTTRHALGAAAATTTVASAAAAAASLLSKYNMFTFLVCTVLLPWQMKPLLEFNPRQNHDHAGSDRWYMYVLRLSNDC